VLNIVGLVREIGPFVVEGAPLTQVADGKPPNVFPINNQLTSSSFHSDHPVKRHLVEVTGANAAK
jgi:hypothetical protein